MSKYAQEKMRRRFPGFPYHKLLLEQEEQIVRELGLYTQENQIALTVDQANLIVSFIVSHLESNPSGAYSESLLEATDTTEVMRSVNQLGFAGILQKMKDTDTIMWHLAARYLENTFLFYDIDSRTVDASDYEIALGIFGCMMYQKMGSTFVISDFLSLEKVRQFVQPYRDEDINTLSFFDISTLDQADLLIEILHKNGVNLEKRHGANGFMLLHMAVEQIKPFLVERLLAAGADPNAQSYSDVTPLHIAAEKGNLVVVDSLCSAGACWDMKTDLDDSILMCAVDANDLSLTRYLLASGIGVSWDEQTEIAEEFFGFAFREFHHEQKERVIIQLCEYAQENQVDLPVDVARLITSFVVSCFGA